MLQDQAMPVSQPSGPDPETIVDYIRQTYPETVVLEMTGTWFFSLDEKHWPNFATIVTTDEHDQASNLSRPDVFRLNIGVDRPTFQRVGRRERDARLHDPRSAVPPPRVREAALDQHHQPERTTFEAVVVPLLELAHGRLAAARDRHKGPSAG